MYVRVRDMSGKKVGSRIILHEMRNIEIIEIYKYFLEQKMGFSIEIT